MNDSNQEFQNFIHNDNKSPSDQLDTTILSHVKTELDPSHQKVFAKILSVQAFIGAATMLFCPQFEMSLTNQDELYHYFHRTFGHYGCMAFCGFLFIGSGALFASQILSLSEIRKIRSSRFLYFVSMSGLFILSFLILGANVYLEISFFWLLGALVGGLSMFELGRFAKIKRLQI